MSKKIGGLVITRRLNEGICIGGVVNVYVTHIKGGSQVKLTIEAPRTVTIGRMETMHKYVNKKTLETQDEQT